MGGHPMERVGAASARAALSRLLRRVEAGERFIITRRGRAVAELRPVAARNEETIQNAIERLEVFQGTHDLGGVSIRALIEEGRRY